MKKQFLYLIFVVVYISPGQQQISMFLMGKHMLEITL